LSLPIFDGGRLNAQLNSKTAEKDQAIALYNSTLLEALKESSDAVSALKNIRNEVILNQASLKLANDRLNLQTQKAKAGLIGQVSVLRETASQLQIQRLNAQSQAKALNSEVLMLKALGAGGPDSMQPG
jgi:outer membrane protein TolC